MKRLGIGIIGVVLLIVFGASDQAWATARVGDLMDEFELQATDGRFYGTKNTGDKVTVLYFVGYS